jgi:hypothetical protein
MPYSIFEACLLAFKCRIAIQFFLIAVYTDEHHKDNISANPLLTNGVKKTNRLLLQLSVLLTAVSILTAAESFTNGNWTRGTFNGRFMLSISAHILFILSLLHHNALLE